VMPALKTHIWAPALIRRAEGAGAYAAVIKKGDPDSGTAMIKVRTLDGNAVLYRPIRNMEGTRVWLPKGPDTEREIDLYINKQIDDDPDLWIIEVEDREGRSFLTEGIEGS